MSRCLAGCLGVAILASSACEPPPAEGIVVDGLPCPSGTLPANFTGLVAGVPFDHAFRVVVADDGDDGDDGDDPGVVVVDAVFGAGSDPAMSLLRAPFATDDAWIVLFRVQPTTAGRVEGALVLTPVEETLSPCTVAVSATTR